MKCFRIIKPEYALIAANSIDEAVQLYKDHIYPFSDSCAGMSVDFEEVSLTAQCVSNNGLLDNEKRLLLTKLLKQNNTLLADLLNKYASKEGIWLDSDDFIY
ncbi:MAG: hypothetical protein [Caudoviricetes sp.]|nr:MAG: hypothetical protein [Caudoviricetes sp.]